MNCWELLNAVMPYARRVLLFGPPGTGKTYIATMGVQNCYAITMTEGMPVAELRGHYIPTGNEFSWQDGPAIRAWREGARLVLNEIDKASDEVQTFLHVILDDLRTAIETLPTGETVRPADGFSVVATMNGVPTDLPEALRDRFPVQINVEDINPEAIKKLPDDLHEVALKTSDVKDTERRLSIRAWDEFSILRAHVGSHAAGWAVFGKRWSELQNAVRIHNAPDASRSLTTHDEVANGSAISIA